MSNEIKNMVAVELSEAELDTVAGGFSISIGEGQNLALDTTSSFGQKNIGVLQQTFAGPGGAGTSTQVMGQNTSSNAGQALGFGN